MEIVNRSAVDYIDKLGTDLTVVNAARVSFDKTSTWLDDPAALHPNITVPVHNMRPEDKKLLGYLADNNHWSPFAHVQIQLRITAPIFVARQLVKHQIGLVWNEVSRRYVADAPTYFLPSVWRGKPIDGAKQGSHGEIVMPDEMLARIHRLMEDSVDVYQDLMRMGVAAEQARMFLLQNMMTSWYWTGSLQACARICMLRLDAHAQGETKEVALEIDHICENHFPNAWRVLSKAWRA